MAATRQTAEVPAVKKQTAKRLLEGKSLGGRPTKYTNQVIRNAKQYLAKYSETGALIPSIAGLSKYLNIRRETLQVWANESDKVEFSNIVSRLRACQEVDLLQGGLSGDMNPTIAKLVLSKHGYHDNQGVSAPSISVTINRGSVQVETQGQTIEVETD